MANPNPIYVVNFNSEDLPGYLTHEEIPVTKNSYGVRVLGRDGGFFGQHGYDFREINLTFTVISRLSSNSTGLQHLEDCKEQWRDALRLTSRVDGSAALMIGATDRYVNAIFVESTLPLEAPVFRRMSYTLKFLAEPWFLTTPASTITQAISGDDTISFTPGDSRKTYPIFTIGSGITEIHLSDGQLEIILSGSHGGAWIVDCGNLTILEDGFPPTNAISVLQSFPNFGMFYQGTDTDTYEIATSGVVGSDDVTIDITLRHER